MPDDNYLSNPWENAAVSGGALATPALKTPAVEGGQDSTGQDSGGDNALAQMFSPSDMNTFKSLGLDAVALSSYPCWGRAARYAAASVAVVGTCGISLPAVLLAETPPTFVIAAAAVAGCIGS